MISVEEALQRILAGFQPLPAEVLPIGEAFGRVLAEPLVARATQPPAAVSAMDGYAVRAADVAAVPCELEVVGHVPAGSSHDGRLQPGQAVRIFTGAPLPEGADSIVIQEDTEALDGRVRVLESVRQGNYVRPAGLDFRAGEVGLEAGRRLTARDVGLAAAMDRPWLSVRRRPRVAILATGDEVVMPGEPRGPNQIVSSNGLSLSAAVRACGGEPLLLAIARDDAASLQALAGEARGADLLVTTGGASVGEHDLVRQALGERGLELDFWQIAMRPGKPLMFGRIQGTPLLGLPGNPVSTVVCATLFLRPVLERLQGLERPPHRLLPARLGVPLKQNDRRQDYLRSRLERQPDGTVVASPFPRQDSSMLAVLSQAEGLVVRAPHAPPAAAGDPIAYLPLDGDLLSL
ncbi:molybdopterin molybdochelatase [Tistlia consotensis]|uniref:Molybdopterin molybdenumtransferase n=1 Tax=Tistlia consotensis USBA 355 TaxID=560819 RepID=A0A1Y6CJD8_9PROT|nr:gephyrin-like molybdotransferase Glp [Tistlia consotensis]SMF69909.1 molybdopterin molybdochelatase [Tistlia consotensis USBA 355]SNS05116.1 molybdopterin molybdochelatase [Tistlia consotensis]